MTPTSPARGRQRRHDVNAALLAGMEHDAGRFGFELEPSQRRAAEHLAAFGASVTGRRRTFPATMARSGTPRSVYLHGPVGRGKTWLMDSFYRALQARKRRVHFHDFFKTLHRGTHRTLGTSDGTAIQRSVETLLADIDVLFFDEFHVHDVGDGMFIARLLRTAAQRRVPLVVTSNYAPDDLLPNPLWHDHFVPTIEAIKDMMDVVAVEGPSDFRRYPVAGAQADATPRAFSSGRIISPGTARQLGRVGLFEPPASQSRVLTPTTQPIVVKNADPEVLWVGFGALFAGLTSTADYLVLAETYKTWVIDEVPSPALAEIASAPSWQRFSNAVDVLYDQDITLFLIGEGPLDWDAAGTGNVQTVDLARIASRLSLLARSPAEESNEESAGS